MSASVFGALGKENAVVPTSIKTSAYTAAAGDFIPVDVSGGSVTITLPAAPADQTRIGVKLVKLTGANTVTINCSGSDKFNDDATTTATLKLLNQGAIFQYALAAGIWYIQSDDLPLTALDARYGSGTANWLNVKAYGAAGDGITDDTTAFQNALTAAAPSSPTAASGTVFVPSGFYMVGPLSIPHRVTLRGAGVGATTLTAKAGIAAAGPLITNATHAEMVTIMDMRLFGNAGSQTHTINGLLFSGNWTYSSSTDEYNDVRCRALNLHIENFNGDAVQSTIKHASVFDNIQVFECQGNGFSLSNDDEVSNCDVGSVGLDGFLIAGNSLVSNCKAWFCGFNGSTSAVTSGAVTTGNGFHITAGDGGTLANCYAQDCGRAGFYFDAAADVMAVGLTADSCNNNNSSTTFAGFDFDHYAGPVTCYGHAFDRGANTQHMAAAGRFGAAQAPAGVMLVLNYASNANMAALWTADTDLTVLSGYNQVTAINSSGAGQQVWGPQKITGGLTADALKVMEGTNAKQGTATLAAGTVTVANTSVTANSRIFLTCQSLGTVTAPSALAVTARTAGTSFTITASQSTDTSVIAYEIIEPG